MISLFIIYVIGCILSYGLSYNFWYESEKEFLPIPIDMENHKPFIVLFSLLSFANVVACIICSFISNHKIRLKYRSK